MRYVFFTLMVFVTAGCVQLPQTAADIQGKKFESIADKAVIYIVRPRVNGLVSAPLSLSTGMISTQQGTYYRWEVAPGTHRIEGSGMHTAAITVQAEAGKIYFVEQTADGGARDGLTKMSLRRIDENRGRKMVSEAQSL